MPPADDADAGPRVLHVIPEDGTGGVEIAAKTMLSRRDLPCRFELLFVLNQTRPSSDRQVKGASNLSPRSLSAYLGAWRRIRASGAQVLVFSLWKTVPLLVLARLLLRARIVYFLHIDTPTHRVDAAFSRVAMWMAHAVWADSDATVASRRVPAGKPTRVISFVTERLLPLARVATLVASFVSWGRLHEQKGINRSIELVAALVERGVDATFHAYGRDDGARSALIARAERLGVADRVHFPGVIAREQLVEIAANASFFLQLSRSEGMCMAAVEGMQLGLVPVATAVGQMRDYVRPGETGLLVDAEDLSAAADALVALLAEPERYAALADGARRYWLDAPLYADDFCAAARALASHAQDGRESRPRGPLGV